MRDKYEVVDWPLVDLLRRLRKKEFNEMRYKFPFPNLSGADLSNANLSGADLTYAKLRGASLSSSIIIGVKYQANNLNCDYTDFTDAIIDDERLYIQLREGKAKNVSPAAKSKKELREKLEKHGELHADIIDRLLSLSHLPE